MARGRRRASVRMSMCGLTHRTHVPPVTNSTLTTPVGYSLFTRCYDAAVTIFRDWVTNMCSPLFTAASLSTEHIQTLSRSGEPHTGDEDGQQHLHQSLKTPRHIG